MKSIDRLLTLLAVTCAALACISTLPARADDGVDVQKVMAARGCLGCHAIDKKIVGPAFHDVAARYSADAQAAAKVAANIRNGGVGRWGQVPMPSMTGLSDAEVAALAEFVLKQ